MLRRWRWRKRGREGSGDDERRTLDWRAALARLDPVRYRWDLAILCNLDEESGRRPAKILTAINDQTDPGRRLSPQVLSIRLRELEEGGYVSHEDLSVMPLNRVYYLRQPGRALITDLTLIIGPGSCA